MFLRFVTAEGNELTDECDSYQVKHLHGIKTQHMLITAMHKSGTPAMYETSYEMKEEDEESYHSFFVMNENGKTIDKVIFLSQFPEETVEDMEFMPLVEIAPGFQIECRDAQEAEVLRAIGSTFQTLQHDPDTCLKDLIGYYQDMMDEEDEDLQDEDDLSSRDFIVG